MAVLLISCVDGSGELQESSCRYARYFDIIKLPSTQADTDSLTAVITISPYDSSRDTLVVESPMDNIVCMSTSQVAGLAAIGADEVISAVSGLRYISNPSIRSRSVSDIGYEASLDYEQILKLAPDVVLTYTVSGAEPPYLSRLRSLGVRVLVLHDHLEEHPLARAEYIRLYGVLSGRTSCADSLFTAISARYDSLATNVVESMNEHSVRSLDGQEERRVKVLMNVPYGDAWYIPGGNSYMARLVSDAGGEVLGAEEGTAKSRVISLEQAYELSRQADMWLNPGPFRTRKSLEDSHHAFPMFGPLKEGKPIYNNTLRTTPEGGNDFWESGSVRPDLILEDLITIFSDIIPGEQSDRGNPLKYHFEVE